MKLNRKLRDSIIGCMLIGASFTLGIQWGEQNILDRWEDRWFESDWYDTKTIEEFLYDTQWENLGQELDAYDCLLYTSPSPRDLSTSRMPSSA